MANATNDFTWNEENVNNLAKNVASEHRKLRPLLTLHGKPGWTTNVIGHKIIFNNTKTEQFISVQAQNLTPVILSCELRLGEEHFGDDGMALENSVKQAALNIAQAEDAVILLGSEAKEKLKTLGVTHKNLESQSGIFPNNLDVHVPKDQSVLDSIVQGMLKLENDGRSRKYAAVVSLNLLQQASRRRVNAPDTELTEIRNLQDMMPNGFVQSRFLDGRKGLVMSLSGDSVQLAVPVDISVQLKKVEEEAFIRVYEHIRLVINITNAIVPLQEITEIQ
ncbi:hypothetical protein MGMO_19c00010 [Methyloglobulus morosus KoM1]|uniref:Uncharacterized protein n=1 Tax=Methyloglobulus morosus KoM1 TaxID=1116472 RepID=V5E1P7_9GAMM|nr:family 1 encapsulin nanocompartment shell protein [Methyloglobulus morosus]ESS73481.1 hypothetical protein MGMO_19c00010 [Methyloglobulus morosus KoM1]